ncbi:MAG: 2-isopropylmalate synthase [Candidatus Omnitrophica bacterium]|nr:2-isopropylmalate synthase [Candidatus Omnitrophota bacterium]MBU4479086.1 2-isopropylmalate synthase [Candidatus Omnitrophota bacterium]MCG2703007.1 2-isopropylmalate synthase [Candidatus Omnitrophota bacterium]
MLKKIIIFDTTLRDGEQAPGASLTGREKLEVALGLVRLGVDVIEAGFPISSPGDFNSVRMIAQQVKGVVICGLARSLNKDIEAAAAALKPAKRKRIHVFLATSKIHMRYKLKKAESEILKIAEAAVKYAREFSDDIQFSPEDASRTEPDFLFRVVETVIKAGATTVNIPDTVGYAQPEEFGSLIKAICNTVPNIHKAVIAVHCHNDLGLAVANSLAAVRNGAGQVECTINGIGERAGNAALEEIVLSLRTRKGYFKGILTSINTKEIYKISRLVSKLTGFVVAPNKAIVGGNAFRHESGIHQDGVLKKRRTYEIISPEDVGFYGEGLVLGKHSGRHALSERLKQLGFVLNNDQLEQAFSRFKELADKKKEIFEEDLLSIVEEQMKGLPQVWSLAGLEFCGGTSVKPRATIKLKNKDKTYTASSSGDGPVDAGYKAIEKITKIKAKLLDYSLQAVTSGKDALGEVSIKLEIKNKEVPGRAASTDIVEASVKAYLNAINRVLFQAEKSPAIRL